MTRVTYTFKDTVVNDLATALAIKERTGQNYKVTYEKIKEKCGGQAKYAGKAIPQYIGTYKLAK